jgi:hypothetical protein
MMGSVITKQLPHEEWKVLQSADYTGHSKSNINYKNRDNAGYLRISSTQLQRFNFKLIIYILLNLN